MILNEEIQIGKHKIKEQLTWMDEFFVKFSQSVNTNFSSFDMIYHSIWIIFTNNTVCFLLNTVRRIPWFMDVLLRKIMKCWHIFPKEILRVYHCNKTLLLNTNNFIIKFSTINCRTNSLNEVLKFLMMTKLVTQKLIS